MYAVCHPNSFLFKTFAQQFLYVHFGSFLGTSDAYATSTNGYGATSLIGCVGNPTYDFRRMTNSHLCLSTDKINRSCPILLLDHLHLEK